MQSSISKDQLPQEQTDGHWKEESLNVENKGVQNLDFHATIVMVFKLTTKGLPASCGHKTSWQTSLFFTSRSRRGELMNFEAYKITRTNQGENHVKGAG